MLRPSHPENPKKVPALLAVWDLREYVPSQEQMARVFGADTTAPQ